jgi:hypothetical protein
VTNEKMATIAKKGNEVPWARRQIHYSFVRKILDPFRSSTEEQRGSEFGPITL